IVIVGGREFDGLLPDVGFGDLDGTGVFIHTEDMAEENLGDQDTVIVKMVAAAEGEGGFDVGRHFGEVEFAIVGLENFLDPGAGLVYALVLMPETTENFDE